MISFNCWQIQMCLHSVYSHLARQPKQATAVSFFRFLNHTQWHSTFGRTPLDKGSARRRDLWQHTKHSQETDMSVPGGIRTRDPSKRSAADPRLRPLGHGDRHLDTALPKANILRHDIISSSALNGPIPELARPLLSSASSNFFRAY